MALLLRSAEIKPWFNRFVPLEHFSLPFHHKNWVSVCILTCTIPPKIYLTPLHVSVTFTNKYTQTHNTHTHIQHTHLHTLTHTYTHTHTHTYTHTRTHTHTNTTHTNTHKHTHTHTHTTHTHLWKLYTGNDFLLSRRVN